jgi:hypothetical protein
MLYKFNTAFHRQVAVDQRDEALKRAVILSPFASLRVNCAKDLHLLVFKVTLWMLRSAQHDR